MNSYPKRRIVNPDGKIIEQIPFTVDEENKSVKEILQDIVIALSNMRHPNFYKIDDLLMQAGFVALKENEINEKIALSKKLDLKRKELSDFDKRYKTASKKK